MQAASTDFLLVQDELSSEGDGGSKGICLPHPTPVPGDATGGWLCLSDGGYLLRSGVFPLWVY